MKIILSLIIYIFIVFSTLFAEVRMGADVVSRYVWRGSDYGNAAAIQPFIERGMGKIIIGAWGSWSISPGMYYNSNDKEMISESSGNECDLYVSMDVGSFGFTLTDYFFPEYNGADEFLNINKHTIELSVKTGMGSVSILTAVNLMGGENPNSSYLELGYGAFLLGFGNGDYSVDGDFIPISIGVNAVRENISVSYIINPNKETSFLVFGASF